MSMTQKEQLPDHFSQTDYWRNAFVEAQGQILAQRITMRQALELMGVPVGDVVDLQEQLINRARYCGAAARGVEAAMFEIEKLGRPE